MVGRWRSNPIGNIIGRLRRDGRHHLAHDLQPFRMPKDETLLQLADTRFSGATYISFISHSIIVEYAKMDEKAWCQHLQQLPYCLRNTGIGLSFMNGPMVGTELKGLKAPKPNILAALQEDDSKYVKAQGIFYPGTMLCANSGVQISAGIAVQNENDIRLTVDLHSWDSEYAELPDQLGEVEHSRVTQGTSLVGHVELRIGMTDTGLVKLNPDIVFQNRFLNIDAVPRILLHSDKVQINDEFVIDSFVTSPLRLRAQGVRFRRLEDRREELKERAKDLAEPGKHVALKQMIYATGSPEINRVPKIRAGMCGSAVVRVRDAAATGENFLPDGPLALDKGEVAGFMSRTGLCTENEMGGQLLCFADSVDELIVKGWKVCSS